MEVSFQYYCHYCHLPEFLIISISLSTTEVSCCGYSISLPQLIAREYASFTAAVLSFVSEPVIQHVHYKDSVK